MVADPPPVAVAVEPASAEAQLAPRDGWSRSSADLVEPNVVEVETELVASGLAFPLGLSADDDAVMVELRHSNANKPSTLVAFEHASKRKRVIASDVPSSSRIEQAGAHLLLATYDSKIIKLDKRTGKHRELSHGADVLVDDGVTYIYRRDGNEDEASWDGPMVIEQRGHDEGAGELVATLPGTWSPELGDLTRAGQHLYWLARPPGTEGVTNPKLARVALAGGEVELLTTVRLADTLASFRGKVFAGSLTSMAMAVPEDRTVVETGVGASIESLAPGPSFLFAAGWGEEYFGGEQAPGQLFGFRNSASPAIAIETVGQPVSLAVGGGWLYWLEYDGQPAFGRQANRLRRIKLSSLPGR